MRGDPAGDGGGAVHGDEDADVVAGADAAVAPCVAQEGGALFRRQQVRGAVVLREAVVLLHLVHQHVVGVQIGAGRAVLARKADDRGVFQHRRATGDVPGGYLVARGHVRKRHQPVAQVGARGDGHARDGGVVLRIEADQGAGHGVRRAGCQGIGHRPVFCRQSSYFWRCSSLVQG